MTEGDRRRRFDAASRVEWAGCEDVYSTELHVLAMAAKRQLEPDSIGWHEDSVKLVFGNKAHDVGAQDIEDLLHALDRAALARAAIKARVDLAGQQVKAQVQVEPAQERRVITGAVSSPLAEADITSDPDLQIPRMGAVQHDVGKSVGIPD